MTTTLEALEARISALERRAARRRKPATPAQKAREKARLAARYQAMRADPVRYEAHKKAMREGAKRRNGAI